MSRSYTSFPPQAPPWHVAGQLYFYLSFFIGPHTDFFQVFYDFTESAQEGKRMITSGKKVKMSTPVDCYQFSYTSYDGEKYSVTINKLPALFQLMPLSAHFPIPSILWSSHRVHVAAGGGGGAPRPPPHPSSNNKQKRKQKKIKK
jgi:hypothetical protein